MKRTERHHLKDNELNRLALSARRMMEARKGLIQALLVAVVVAGVGAIGYYAWRARAENRAYSLLAEATIVEETTVGPPADPTASDTSARFPTVQAKAEAAAAKYKAVAEGYPSTDAGLFAAYREGATLMLLNQPAQAATAFQRVASVSELDDRIRAAAGRNTVELIGGRRRAFAGTLRSGRRGVAASQMRKGSSAFVAQVAKRTRPAARPKRGWSVFRGIGLSHPT